MSTGGEKLLTFSDGNVLGIQNIQNPFHATKQQKDTKTTTNENWNHETRSQKHSPEGRLGTSRGMDTRGMGTRGLGAR